MGGFVIFERNFRFGSPSRAYGMPHLSSTQRFCPRAGTIDTMRKGQVLRSGILGKWKSGQCGPEPHSGNGTDRGSPACDVAVHSGNNFREVEAIRPEAAKRGKD